MNLPCLRHFRLVVLASGLFLAGAAIAVAAGKTTVFLISLDGIRPDYIERVDTPFFDSMMETGAYSLQMSPAFPTVTFQSHVNIATGAKAAIHGVTMNSFYDTRTRTRTRMAGDQALLEAEPFWTTATRQGVRTLVLDWVKSHNQTGPYATAYFGTSYTRGMRDEDRVERILQTWEDDRHEEPLRFILAYAESPDTEGHRYGPDAPETVARLGELDTFMKSVRERVIALWERDAGPEDVLYFIALSDHGMAATEYHVDLRKGMEIDQRITVMTTSAFSHFFFDQIEDRTEAAELKASIRKKLESIEPITVFARDELPEEWGYAHPYRTGDLIALLPGNHAFFRHDGDEVIQPSRVTGRFFGAHGYDPRTEPTMMTVFFAQRFPEPLRRGNLGPIHASQIHATVAALLGIEPSPQALPRPLPLID